eukprot:7398510-Prorocentrum_lima.AAC.1
MTSSLVGSEMCIRDSPAIQYKAVAAQHGLGCVQHDAAPTPGEMEAAEAVSYTHLTLPTICSV